MYNIDELRTVASRGIAASRIGQVVIEESVLGWEKLELEGTESPDLAPYMDHTTAQYKSMVGFIAKDLGVTTLKF